MIVFFALNFQNVKSVFYINNFSTFIILDLLSLSNYFRIGAGRTGFEPVTPAVTGQCSNQIELPAQISKCLFINIIFSF